MFGFGLAVAVFIDATIVRLVLVPATMELLGDAQLVAARLARPDPAEDEPGDRVGPRDRRTGRAGPGRVAVALDLRPRDGHNDLLWALREAREDGGAEPDVGASAPQLQTDLPRLAAGERRRAVLVGVRPLRPAARSAVTQTLEQIDAFFGLSVATRAGSSRRAPHPTSERSRPRAGSRR